MATFGKLFPSIIPIVLSQLLAASQPFYAKADLAAEPSFAGTFAAMRPATDSGPSSLRDGVVIRRDADGYRVVFKDIKVYGTDDSAEFTARLFTLGVDEDDRPCYFFDLTPGAGSRRRAPAGASHLALAARWDREGSELRLGTIDRRWLGSQLASGLLPRRKAAESEVVLTASTSQLRRLLLLASAQGAVDWSDPFYRQR